jgi:hypothetical protein
MPNIGNQKILHRHPVFLIQLVLLSSLKITSCLTYLSFQLLRYNRMLVLTLFMTLPTF